MPDQVTQDQATFAQWAASVEQLGGVPTNWPFQSGLYGRYYGQPAARFDVATYANVANAGGIDMNAPQQTTANNQYVYVLANGIIQQAAQSLTQPTQHEIQAGATAWMQEHGLSFFDPNAPSGSGPSIFDIGKYLALAGIVVGGLVLVNVLNLGRRR